MCSINVVDYLMVNGSVLQAAQFDCSICFLLIRRNIINFTYFRFLSLSLKHLPFFVGGDHQAKAGQGPQEDPGAQGQISH